MIVLDASVLIAHVEPADAHHEAAGALLASLADEEWGLSPITLAEFYVGPARTGALERAERVVRRLGLHVIAFEIDAPKRLAGLRADTRLKMPDCCVLLATEQVGGAVASFDTHVRREAGLLGLDVAG